MFPRIPSKRWNWRAVQSSPLGLVLLTLAFSCPAGPAQIDWVKSGKDWLRLWKAGRIDLQDPMPRSNPLVLPGKDPRILELIKAKGTYFFWSHENELSFLCSGLAADVTGEGRKVLTQMAEQTVSVKPGRELSNPRTLRMQPWTLRRQARQSLSRLRDPDVRRHFASILAIDEKKGPASDKQRVLASATLEECGDHGDADSLLPGVEAADPLVRAASARALGRISGERALETLIPRLDVEKDPAVRIHLWAALVPCTESLGDWKERRDKQVWKDICARAKRILLTDGTPVAEKIALARWIWNVRPDLLLADLPGALAKAQGPGPGKQRLRWWLQGILVDMIGSGYTRSRIRGQEPRPDPGPTEAEAWQERLDSMGRAVPMTRRHRLKHPPYPKDAPGLFGLPLQGERILLLLDVSEPFAGPLVPESTSSSSNSKASKEDRRTDLGEDIVDKLLAALAEMPDTTEVRILAYGKKVSAYPRTGYLVLDKKGRAKVRAFLGKQDGSGPANPSTPLLELLGQDRGLPCALAPRETPDAIYWMAIAPPMEGPVRTAGTLTDLCLASNALWTTPVFIAYFPDRRSKARRTPFYQLGNAFNTSLRRLAQESMGAYQYRSYRPGK